MADSLLYNGIYHNKTGEKTNSFTPEVANWDNQTSNFPSDPKFRLGSNYTVQSADPSVLDPKEPWIGGRFFVKCIKAPSMMPDTMVDVLRFLFEDSVKEYSGLGSRSIDTTTVTFGANGQQADFPTLTKENNKNVTFKVPVFKGELVRKFIDWWMGGITDAKTNIGHMYGLKIPRQRSSYGASFLICILGPTAKPDDIEYSCIFHECFPMTQANSHLGSMTLGEANAVADVDIEFTGVFDESPEVNMLAKLFTAALALYSISAWDSLLPGYVYDNYFSNFNTASASELHAEYSVKPRDIIDRLNTNHPSISHNYTTETTAHMDTIKSLVGKQVKSIDINYTFDDAFNDIFV